MKEVYNEEYEDDDDEYDDEESISEEKREKNFKALKSFLKADMEIKEELIKGAPSSEDDYNEKSRIDYTDKLDRMLKDFEAEFKSVSNGFEFGDAVSNSIKDFFKKARENLAIGKYETGIGNDLYQQKFSTMRPEFVDEVKRRCIGYTCATPERLSKLFDKATSVNEMLHAMHSFVMNNEQIMSSMPKLGEKENSTGYPITLYGEMSEVGNKIFENFPLDMGDGWTDIISMKDRVCMMVRDRGHALTIDMDTSKEEVVDVKYFIPKLCNEEMIRALKGIDKANITPSGARGGFIAKKEEITEELFGFIEKVPTDTDIPRPSREEIMASISAFQEKMKAETLDKKRIETDKNKLTLDTAKPIFSANEAKEMASEPERRIGKLKEMQKKISKIFSPLINKFKSNGSRNVELKDDIGEEER